MFGALGLSLVFVGFTLVFNGIAILQRLDRKSIIVVNLITAFLLFLINTISLVNAIGGSSDVSQYVSVAQGYLFAFTYLFIAMNHLLKLDPRTFGWYCLFATVFATVCATMSFYRYTESMKCGVGCDPGQTINLTFGFLWIIWGLLWLEGFLEINCKLGFLTKIKAFPILSILEGVLATGFVGLLMLINHFPL